MTEFDGIIIGGGHNGLVCANYLARAGQKVLVLEATNTVGGGLRTIEAPVAGFLFNTHAVAMRWNTSYKVWKDLEMDKYGPELIAPKVQYAQPMSDKSCIIMHAEVERTVASIKKISPEDAETFRRLHSQVEEVIRGIFAVDRFAAPLPPDEARDLLSKSATGRLYLEFADTSVIELIEANFKHDAIRALLACVSSLRGHGPVLDRKGNGIVLPLLLHAAQNGCLVKGGSARLAEGLVRSLYTKGGVVLKGRPAEKILVEGGRAVGVKSGGQEFRARKFIVSNLMPGPTLLELAGPQHLDPALVERIKGYKPKREALFGLHVAHAEQPRYLASETEPLLQEAFVINAGYESLEDIKSDMRDIWAGKPPEKPKMTLVTPTVHDPTQAPPGMHSTLLWQFAPCELADGGIEAWDKISHGYGEKILDSWAHYAPNVKGEALLGWITHSSMDTLRTIPSMVLGDRHHGEYSPDQMGYFRPAPELSQYATPIEGLYLCGSSTHPGGSITGAPGHNAATRIAKDLGLPLWWNPPDVRAALRSLK